MKQDEIALVRLVLNVANPSIDQLRDASPRWPYLLTKWARRGRWEYGVSLPTGWLTVSGMAWAVDAAMERGGTEWTREIDEDGNQVRGNK